MRSECKKCKLHQGCKNPFLYRNENGKSSRGNQDGTILVVGSYPRNKDDEAAEFFTSSDPIGNAVRNLSEMLVDKAKVVFHKALSCATFAAPSKKKLKLCRGATLEETIYAHTPSVIICMGGNALYWVTGDDESKVHQHRNKPFETEIAGNKCWVIVVPHLATSHLYVPTSRRANAEDLTDDYIHAFTLANRICKYRCYGQPHRKRCHLVVDEDIAQDWLKETADYTVAAMDVETGNSMHDMTGKTHLNADALTIWHKKSKLVTMSITLAKRIRGPKDKIPQDNKHYGDYKYVTLVLAKDMLEPETISEFFQPFKYRKIKEDRVIICHNLKFDAQSTYRFTGVELYDLAPWEDTFHHAALGDSSLVGYGLKPLAKKYFGAEDWDSDVKEMLKEIQKRFDKKAKKLGKKKRFADYRHLPLKKLALYNAMDTYYTLRLWLEIFSTDTYKKANQSAIDVCKRATESLSVVERNGMPLCKDALQTNAQKNLDYREELMEEFSSLKLVKKAASACGYLDLGKEVFEAELVRVTGVSVPKTKTGKPSVRKDVVWGLAACDTVYGEELLEDDQLTPEQYVWRLFSRIKKTMSLESDFFKAYEKFIVDGFIHTTFHICKSDRGGTKTGRLASTKPQTQNLGKGELVRDCFRAPNIKSDLIDWQKLDDWKADKMRVFADHKWLLLESDYKGIELVFLAHIAQEQKMIEDIINNVDLHSVTARDIYELPEPAELTKERRAVGKTLNFGLIYGQGPRAFAEGCGITLAEAKKFFARYHISKPGISKLFDNIKKDIYAGRMIQTLYGRQRSFKIVGERRFDSRQEREANNYIIQGPAADSTMEHLHFLLQEMNKKPKLHDLIIPCNTVHDSIWFLVRRDYWEKCCQFIKPRMEDIKIFPKEWDWKLPIRVEMEVGTRLSRMREVEFSKKGRARLKKKK